MVEGAEGNAWFIGRLGDGVIVLLDGIFSLGMFVDVTTWDPETSHFVSAEEEEVFNGIVAKAAVALGTGR